MSAWLLTLSAVAISSATTSSVGMIDKKTVHYDAIEVNVYCDDYGLPIFTQLLFKDWSTRHRCYVTQAWFIVKDAWDKDDRSGLEAFEAWKERCKRKVRFNESLRLDEIAFPGVFVGGKYFPKKNHRTGKYEVTRRSEATGDTEVLITSDSFWVTTSLSDPEVKDRKLIPDAERRGFRSRRDHIVDSIFGGSEEAMEKYTEAYIAGAVTEN